MLPPEQTGAQLLQHNPHCRGQKQQQQNRQLIPDCGQGFPPEVGHRRTPKSHLTHGIQGSKDKVIHQLAAVQHCQHQAHRQIRPEAGLSGHKRQRKSQKQSNGRRKAQGIQEFLPDAAESPYLKQNLPVQQRAKPEQSLKDCREIPAFLQKPPAFPILHANNTFLCKHSHQGSIISQFFPKVIPRTAKNPHPEPTECGFHAYYRAE